MSDHRLETWIEWARIRGASRRIVRLFVKQRTVRVYFPQSRAIHLFG